MPPETTENAPPPPRPGRRVVTRRTVLRAAAAGAFAAAGALGWAVGVEPRWLEVTERTLELAGLPDALAGKRLVQISDLHVGRTGADYLISAVRRANALEPAIVAITGDVLDHAHRGGLDDLARVIGALRPPSVATVACLGNHDYGRGWSDVALADRIAGTLAVAGVRVLRNERAEVGGVTVVGLDDYWSPRFDPTPAFDGIGGSRDAICLCHNPDVCERPVWAGFRGQVLAGHTHGGQCKPPFLPPPLLPVATRRFVAGSYDVGPRRRLYISRGIGHTLRARFNCRPELTVFTLRAAPVTGTSHEA